MSIRADKDGKISVFSIKVPLDVALGLFENLNDHELEEHYYDIRAECERRGFELDLKA